MFRAMHDWDPEFDSVSSAAFLAGPGRRFRARFRGGPFGGPFGPRAGRLFGRGEIKYLILDQLREQPRHGYDIIHALEERFYGFYSPSPGSVYPTLQMLEDQGYVTSTQQEGKRVYAITDEGRKLLSEHQAQVEEIRDRLGAGWGGPARGEIADLMQEAGTLARFLAQQASRGGFRDPEKAHRVREVIRRARGEIERIFNESEPPSTVV